MEQIFLPAIRDYFLTCPMMAGGSIPFDFLPDAPMAYTVDAVPELSVVKTYTDSSSIRQYRFLIQSTGSYSPGVLQQIADSGVYESLADWLETQAQQENLPLLPSGREALRLELDGAGPLLAENASEGTWRMQGTLQYFQEA